MATTTHQQDITQTSNAFESLDANSDVESVGTPSEPSTPIKQIISKTPAAPRKISREFQGGRECVRLVRNDITESDFPSLGAPVKKKSKRERREARNSTRSSSGEGSS
jgi:hypothetical protein